MAQLDGLHLRLLQYHLVPLLSQKLQELPERNQQLPLMLGPHNHSRLEYLLLQMAQRNLP
jgi:hypothetical protein